MNKKRIESFLKAVSLSRKPGIGAAKFKELLDQYKTIEVAYETTISKALKTKHENKVQFDITDISKKVSSEICTEVSWYGDTKYPNKLKLLTEPPPILFLKGDLEVLKPKKTIGIVGSRDCSQNAKNWLTKYIKTNLDTTYAIISGMADGIDKTAHSSALKNNISTIGVIATGIDIMFPASCQSLYQKMYSKGIICTEFLPNTQPRPSFFPTRNRIIAGLSDSVLVVEATAKSGALYTAKNASKQGKKIFVPPLSIISKLKHQEGLLYLIKKYNAISIDD